MCIVPYIHPHDVTQSNQILYGGQKEKDNFYRVQHALQHAPKPQSQWDAPTSHFWDLRAHRVKNSNQILRGDQTTWEEKFYRVEYALAMAKNFMTRMLTRDLFAVANLYFYWAICGLDAMCKLHYNDFQKLAFIYDIFYDRKQCRR